LATQIIECTGLDDVAIFDVVDPEHLEIGNEVEAHPGLEKSIAELGLLEPPLICGKKVLEGKRRVLAFKQMGITAIRVRRVPVHLSTMARLHYQLVRSHKTVLDIASYVVEWKTDYETKCPLAKAGGNQKAKKQTGTVPFWKHLQGYTSWSQSKIEHLVKIGSMPAEDCTEASKNEHLANDHVKLLHIARYEPIEKLGKVVTRKDIIAGVAAHPNMKISKLIKRLFWEKPTAPAAPELIMDIPPLYCGDFEEVMMTLPEKSIQLVLTDPLWHLEWIDNMPRLAKQIHRILTDDGVAIIYYCTSRINRVFRAMDDVFSQEAFLAQIIDDQGDGTPQPYNPNGYQDKYKSALVYIKSKLIFDPAEGEKTNIFRTKGLANKGSYEYGQSLPMFQYLVRFGSKPGDTVMDCCVGGGTTMLAALNTGRKFVGIDISQNAINICKQVFAEWLKNKKGK
jgi:hypothetical protein